MLNPDYSCRERSEASIAGRPHRYHRRSRGFSLIEVLVAVVILAVGILGVAGLQVVSMQQNRSALLRAQALQMGTDMLDRMRANPTGTYTGIAFEDGPDGATTTCINQTCSEAQMATFDISQWKCSLNSSDADGDPEPVCVALGIGGVLPNGAGSIAKVGAVHEVRVRWQSGAAAENLTTVTLRTRTE
jgi:type IV pilus assembly protein PilV